MSVQERTRTLAGPDGRLFGKIIDLDSHEMMPVQLWVEHFGEVVKPWADFMMAKPADKNEAGGNVQNLPDYSGEAELSADTLWLEKGATAPGSSVMSKRLEVMDLMGVDKQLMFPTGVGLFGAIFYGAPEGSGFHGLFEEDTATYAAKLMAANNDWAVEINRISPRLRPVTPLFGNTPEELTEYTAKLVNDGVRAVQIITGRPPGGVSPASNKLDSFYALLAEARVPLMTHIGGEAAFFASNEWCNAEAFEGYRVTTESSMDPWYMASYHLGAQNLIATMVAGGVFDRHPTLRVGVAEYTAHWIGPLARQLDFWHEKNHSIHPKEFSSTTGVRLPMRPSEYIARNVRVSPFCFEPVGEYIEKFGLEDVYCFASDYPHTEGGTNPVGRFEESLNSLGDEVIEKFFVKNGAFLLPD